MVIGGESIIDNLLNKHSVWCCNIQFQCTHVQNISSLRALRTWQKMGQKDCKSRGSGKLLWVVSPRNFRIPIAIKSHRLDSLNISCLCLPSSSIKGVYHHLPDI